MIDDGGRGKIAWTWVPNVSIGPFEFGEGIEEYFDAFEILEIPEEYDPEVEWEVFGLPDEDVRIFTSEGRIISVACYGEFFLEGRNLIGMPYENVEAMLGQEPDEVGDPIPIEDEEQVPIEFDSLGLQIWTVGGVVVSVFSFADESE